KKSGKTEASWLGSVPDRVPLGTDRPENTVYHFLIPDHGMAAYSDKVVKQHAPDKIKGIGAWKKEFTRKFSSAEIETLERLSGAIDRLWDRHVQELRRIRRRTTDPISIYGRPASDGKAPTSTRQKDRILNQELYSYEVRNSSP